MIEGLEFSAEELTQASADRIADMDTKTGGANEQPESTQVADESEQAQDKVITTATLTEIDKSVLETFPEGMREQLASLPAELVEDLRKGYLRQDDYTRKAQGVAEDRKAVEGSRADAQSWRDLVENDAAREAVIAATNGKAQGKPEEVFDWTTASNEEIQGEIRRQALEISQEVVHERVDAPAQHVAAIKRNALQYRTELGEEVTDGLFGSAWKDMIERYGEAAITPANARHLLEPFVDIQKLKAQIDGSGSGMSERLSKAATTPSSRSSSPKTKPKWQSENRDPNERESMEATLHRLNEMTGGRWSESDLDELLAKG